MFWCRGFLDIGFIVPSARGTGERNLGLDGGVLKIRRGGGRDILAILAVEKRVA
jgi:hypothetical protein